MVLNFVGILEGARQAILSHRLLAPGAFRKGIESLRSWGERPDSALWYARAWAEGRRPPAAEA